MKSSVKFFMLGFLSLTSCLLGGLAIHRFCRGELRLAFQASANKKQYNEQQRRQTTVAGSLKRIKELGGHVGCFGHDHGETLGRYIDLSGWSGASADLECLTPLKEESPKYFFLSLQGCRVDDSDIHHLFALASLDYIDLTDCKVTDEGVGKLKQALPDLTIIRSAQRRSQIAQSPGTKWIQHLPAYLAALADADKNPVRSSGLRSGIFSKDITVLNGSTFLLDGSIRCRLLGLAESEHTDVQARAKEFIQLWLKSYRGIYLTQPTPTHSVWVWVRTIRGL